MNFFSSFLLFPSNRSSFNTPQDIFTNKSHLPTFSSPAIEANLHNIPGLSKRFIYINDDIIFGAPIYPETFYTGDKGYKIYLTWPVPDCAPGCPSNWLGDGFCDSACDVDSCNWDAGDCIVSTSTESIVDSIKLYNFDQSPMSHRQFQQTWCSPSCPTAWLGDNRCDSPCNTSACAFDLTDCSDDEELFSTNYPSIMLPLPSSTSSASSFFNDSGHLEVNITRSIDQLNVLYINVSKLLSLYSAETFKVTRITSSPKLIIRSYNKNSKLQSILISLNSEHIKNEKNDKIVISMEITFYTSQVNLNSASSNDSSIHSLHHFSTHLNGINRTEKYVKKFISCNIFVTNDINIIKSSDSHDISTDTIYSLMKKFGQKPTNISAHLNYSETRKSETIKSRELAKNVETRSVISVSTVSPSSSTTTKSNIDASKRNSHTRVKRATVSQDETLKCNSNIVCERNVMKFEMARDQVTGEIEKILSHRKFRSRVTTKKESVHYNSWNKNKKTYPQMNKKEKSEVASFLRQYNGQVDKSKLFDQSNALQVESLDKGTSFHQDKIMLHKNTVSFIPLTKSLVKF